MPTHYGATDPNAQGAYGAQGPLSQNRYGAGGMAQPDNAQWSSFGFLPGERNPNAPTLPPGHRKKLEEAGGPHQLPQPGPMTYSSPVGANGQIPPPAPTPVQQPVQTVTAAPPPTAQPAQVPQQWQSFAQGEPAPGPGPTPQDQPLPQTHDGGTTTTTSGGAHTGTAGGGEWSAVDSQLQAQLLALLQNPQLFNTQQVDALKESQKESALRQQQDALQQNALSMASRGVSGGYADTFARRMGDATQGNILGAYRDVDLKTTEANREALQNALELASGISLGNRQLGLQGELGRGDLRLREQQLAQQGSQWDQMFPLQQAQILNQILMSKLNYGLDFAQFQQGGSNALAQWLSQFGL